MSRVYVIGDKETGVLFVLLNPLRAAIVPLAEVEKYAGRHGKSTEAAFGDVAAAIQGLILKTDGVDVPEADPLVHDTFRALIAGGTTVSDAAFCFVSEVDSSDWQTFRHSFPPIEPVIAAALGSPGGDVPEAPLKGPGD